MKNTHTSIFSDKVNLAILIIAILAVICIYLLPGCTTQREIDRVLLKYCKGSTETSKDSTNTSNTELIPQDSTYYLTLESIVNAYMECVNGKPIIGRIDTIYQDNNISTSLSMNGNNLIIKAKVDSAAVVARWNEKHTTNTTVVNNSQKEKIPIYTNILTPAQEKWIRLGKWSIAIYSILGLLFLLFIYLKFKSKIIGIFKQKI
jgi:hypothetical protein